jgi:hypothetical protein
MTPTHFATLLIRFYCVVAFIFAAVVLTEIAYYIYLLAEFPSQFDPQREFLLAMFIVRFFIYVITAAAFLIFTKPLAALLAKGLNSIKPDNAS